VCELAGQGASKAELARLFGVTRPVILEIINRYGVIPAQPQLPDPVEPEDTVGPDETVGQGRDGGVAVAESVAAQSVSGGSESLAEPVIEPVIEPGGGRVGTGSLPCRYAGAMLAHAFFARVGAEQVFASLPAARAKAASGPAGAGSGPVVFDDVALVCAVTLAFGLGISSVEGVKHLDRAGAGALAGLVTLPELRTLRPRLAAIADGVDPLAVHTRLARAMLAADAPAVGVYFVDDHFVPYSGAKPVGKGWNTKRKSAMPGRADTLVTDLRGRAVAFVTGEPSGLTKTLPPALAQLRAITGPDTKIMLGFDRGGAYASVFTACRDAGVDWVTYRRGALAATTATPVGHTYVDRDAVATRVVLAEEIIEFKDYGPCRQLTLFEDGRAVLQVLTCDTDAPAAALLSWLRARWRIENAFKDLSAHHGIDWLCDYTADLIPDTTPVANPARTAAKKTLAAAQDEHAAAGRALAALLTTPTRPVKKINEQVPAAHKRLTRAADALAQAQATLKTIPAKVPANAATPHTQRALPRTRRRTFQMVLRLLAYNAELWLADHLNVYLRDNDEYRAHLRHLLHQGGVIDYTPDTIMVTLDRPDSPRLARALTHLAEELNHTPPRIPGDHRPITYHIAEPKH